VKYVTTARHLGAVHRRGDHCGIGRVARWTGQQIALDACIRVTRSYSKINANLLVEGGGFEQVVRAFEGELDAKVGSENFRKCVHLYGHRGEVQPFYDAPEVILFQGSSRIRSRPSFPSRGWRVVR
jgi:hypothetical protein